MTGAALLHVVSVFLREVDAETAQIVTAVTGSKPEAAMERNGRHPRPDATANLRSYKPEP